MDGPALADRLGVDHEALPALLTLAEAKAASLAEGTVDADGRLALYTSDIEHEVVGWPRRVAYGNEVAPKTDQQTTGTVRDRFLGWQQ